jgi:glycerophosphoryl diester phosphodiesterase
MNVAHRGARSLAPENSLAAARLGFETGADMWELDVAVTRDEALVLLHDDTPARTSNVDQVFPGRAGDPAHTFTLAELRRLDFGAWFNERDPFGQIAAGQVTTAMQAGYVGLPIPTLREALLFTHQRGWRVNVEIKDATGTPGDAFVVEKVVALIEELDMLEQALVSSFNHAYLVRARAASERLFTAALVEAPVADPVALARNLGAQGYNPPQSIPPTDIPAIRRAGIDVHVWTVNDPGLMRDMAGHGASAIITDFPQVLRGVLGD